MSYSANLQLIKNRLFQCYYSWSFVGNRALYFKRRNDILNRLIDIFLFFISDDSDGHRVALEVKCPENALLNETISFENTQNETFLLTITCRVMPHHLGRPSLKDGVRLLHGSGCDAMSEATDWKGFE